MKIRRVITRRRLKWVGVIGSLVVVAVMLASRWFYLEATKDVSDGVWIVLVEKGRVGVGVMRGEMFVDPSSGVRFELDSIESPGLELWFEEEQYSPMTTLTVSSYKGPLWAVLLLIMVATALLWYADRRAKPWQCSKCLYDLRGIEGGVCPECGARRVKSE